MTDRLHIPRPRGQLPQRPRQTIRLRLPFRQRSTAQDHHTRAAEKLFHDSILSADNTIACASCHKEPNALSENSPHSLGIDGQLSRRHSMPIFNLAWKSEFFWDGRFDTLEEVVEHYRSGVTPRDTLDPNLAKHPNGGLPLNTEDKAALVAFLKTLTEPKYQR